jgi:hypothetical protein
VGSSLANAGGPSVKTQAAGTSIMGAGLSAYSDILSSQGTAASTDGARGNTRPACARQSRSWRPKVQTSQLSTRRRRSSWGPTNSPRPGTRAGTRSNGLRASMSGTSGPTSSASTNTSRWRLGGRCWAWRRSSQPLINSPSTTAGQGSKRGSIRSPRTERNEL